MNILVIGNGFDLEHNLPTMYGDFLNFIDVIRKIKDNTYTSPQDFGYLIKYNDKVNEYLKNKDLFTKGTRTKYVEELMELSENNVWIGYFLRKSNYSGKGWIDFESEISDVIKSFEYYMNRNIDITKGKIEKTAPVDTQAVEILLKFREGFSEFQQFDGIIGQGLERIISRLEKDLNNLIRCLEIYLGDCIEKIDIPVKSKTIEKISSSIDKVLSFNYTNTFKRIYDGDGKNRTIQYIHGKVELNRDIEETNMVLGIDEYLDEDVKNTKLDFIRFKKYFQRIFKKTGSDYMNWIESICGRHNGDTNMIYFFGHSLDITDKDILGDFLDMEKFMNGYRNPVYITIFYYDKKALAQQIEHSVRIIGQDTLVRKVNDGRIRFIEQER